MIFFLILRILVDIFQGFEGFALKQAMVLVEFWMEILVETNGFHQFFLKVLRVCLKKIMVLVEFWMEILVETNGFHQFL